MRSHPVSQSWFGLHLGIGPRNHLEFEIGHDVLQLEGRMFQEVSRPNQARLFAAPQGKHNRPLRPGLFRQRARQLHHRDRPRSIVVGSGIGLAVLHAQMIEMRTQQDDLVRFLAGNFRQHVPGMRDLPRRDLGMQLDQRAVSRAPQLLRLIGLQDDAVRAGGLVADSLSGSRHRLASR